MVDAFEQLMEFGVGNIILILLLFLAIFVGIVQAGTYLCERFGIETKKTLQEKKRDEEIKKLKEDVLTLQKSADKFNADRINDRAQSFQIQDHWSDLINKITDQQNEIVQSINELADQTHESIARLSEQTRKYQLADMRETLLQAHRYYTSPSTNVMKAWTEMEKHAFDEQYDVYISNKGNSYVENTVKPEMDKLRVVSLDDYDAMSELMESRAKCRG